MDVVHARLRLGTHCHYVTVEPLQRFLKMLTSAVKLQVMRLVFDPVPCLFKLFETSFILTMLHLQTQSGMRP